MNRLRFRTITQASREEYSDPYYSGKPAELSFYFVFSLIPTLLLFLQLLATVSITPDILQALVGRYMSEEGIAQVQQLFDTTKTGGLSLMLAASALWGASKAQYAMMRLSNYAYHGSPKGANYVEDRLRAMQNSLLTMLSLLFGLVLLVYGDAVFRTAFYLLGDTFAESFLDTFGRHTAFLWDSVRWLLGVLLYFSSVLYLFYNAPSKKMKLRQIAPGSLLSATGMILVTAGYSVYIRLLQSASSSTRAIYGSFASVTVLLFWFFLLGAALVAGVVLNAVLLDLGKQQSNGDDSLDVQRLP